MLNKAGKSEGGSALSSHAANVRLEGVTKKFGEIIALTDISLNIVPGELLTLLGPSGCGKTTLLNLIAGYFEPDSGEILIDGKPVTHLPNYARDIGMVFQNYALFPHMNVHRNIGYGLRMRGRPKVEIAERVAAALELVELQGLGERRPRQLSGGQQQRVALARALIIDPKVLLLDEPLSALDKNLRGTMQMELRQLQRRLGVTTVFVTHDQSEALSLSDRIAVMSEGRIRQIDTPQDIYRQPADRFVASFVGDGSILRGRITAKHGQILTVEIGQKRLMGDAAHWPDAAIGDAADIFLRPEDFRLAAPGDAIAISGKIAMLVFQGGHADLMIEADAAISGQLLMRVSANDGAAAAAIGSTVNLAISTDRAAIFAPGRG